MLQYDHRAPEAKAVRAPHKELEPLNGAGDSAIKKTDDRALLNWGPKASKTLKGRSPNLAGFNDTEYISKGHRDKDSYKLNAFNQEESDKLPSDRGVPDTRNYQ